MYRKKIAVLTICSMALTLISGCATQPPRSGRAGFESEIQRKMNSGELQGVQDLQVTYPDGSTHKFNAK